MPCFIVFHRFSIAIASPSLFCISPRLGLVSGDAELPQHLQWRGTQLRHDFRAAGARAKRKSQRFGRWFQAKKMERSAENHRVLHVWTRNLLHVFHMFWPSNLGSSCTCSLPIPGFWGGLGEANPTILRDRSTNTRNWSFTCSGTKLNVRLDHPAFTISQHMYM